MLEVDTEMLKEAKKNRMILPDLVFGECIRVKSESGNGEHKKTCAYTGAILE